MQFNFVSPFTDGTGYGLAGVNLAIELSKRAQVNLCASQPQVTIPNVIEGRAIQTQFRHLSKVDPNLPTLHNVDLGSKPPGHPCILYTCFDCERLPRRRKHFYAQYDAMFTMCAWFAEVMKNEGFEHVYPVVQGFDPTVFFPCLQPRRVYEDQFIFFSGGKLEFRKGQDLVITAYKVIQDRYPDVMLVTSWFNPWPQLMGSMQLSRHVQYVPLNGHGDIPKLLAANGLDMGRVIVLDAIPNLGMPYIYRSCDCGVFPNRTEPANNQVLTEFMACGKPAIASYHTGHLDVLDPQTNCLPLSSFHPIAAGYQRPPSEDLGRWYEPDLDEMIDRMDYAYHHREEIARIGHRAARDMQATRTWSHTAETMLTALRNYLSQADLPAITALCATAL